MAEKSHDDDGQIHVPGWQKGLFPFVLTVVNLSMDIHRTLFMIFSMFRYPGEKRNDIE